MKGYLLMIDGEVEDIGALCELAIFHLRLAGGKDAVLKFFSQAADENLITHEQELEALGHLDDPRFL